MVCPQSSFSFSLGSAAVEKVKFLIILFAWRGSLQQIIWRTVWIEWLGVFWFCSFPRNKPHHFKDSRTFLKNRWCKLADIISFSPEHVRCLPWFHLRDNLPLKCAKSCTDRERLERAFLYSGLGSICHLMNKCYHSPRTTLKHCPAFHFMFL